MRTAAIIAAHHLKRIARSPGLILLLMAIPLTLAGIEYAAFAPAAASGKLPPIKVLVLDEDRTFASSAVPRLIGSGPLADYIELDTTADVPSARRSLQRGQASALLVVPQGFQQALFDRRTAEIRFVPNPAQTISPEIVRSMLEMLTAITNGLLARAQAPLDAINKVVAADRPPTEDEVAEISRGFFRAGQQLQILNQLQNLTVDVKRPSGTTQGFEFRGASSFFAYIFPGLVMFGLMFISQALATRLMRDREAGLQRRIAIAPASRAAILAGGAFYLFVALTVVLVLLALIGSLVFRLKLTSPGTLLVIALGFAFFATGLQLLVISMARSDAGAQAVAGALIMILSLLGGAFVPLESYPPVLRAIGELLPNGAAHQAFIDVLVRQKMLGEILRPVAIIFTWALAFTAVAVTLERRRLTT
jgi:ABC-type multidrug transport system permease subunit